MKERIEYVSLPDGCRLWSAATGAGTPVVLCHGGPGLWDYLQPVSLALEDIAMVHRWDQRGSGRSSRTPPYTLDRFVEDLDLLRQHFGHERWIVGGHSWGATLALTYALRHPDRTCALVYLSGTGIGREWRQHYQQERLRRLDVAGALTRWNELQHRIRTADEERELCVITWMTDFDDMPFGREVAHQMLADGLLPNYEVNTSLSNPLDDEVTMLQRCEALDVPALIVHGSTDPRPPFAVASLARGLPNAQVCVLDGAGHMPWLEQQSAFENVLRTFISEL